MRLKSASKILILLMILIGPVGAETGYADLNDGLVAHYLFDGNTKDETENQNHGIKTSSVGFTEGISGQAAKFYGCSSPGHIRIPNSDSLKFDKTLSISYFVRVDSYTGMDGWGHCRDGGRMTVLAKDHDRSGFDSRVSVRSDGRFSASFRNPEIIDSVLQRFLLGGHMKTPHMNLDNGCMWFL